MSQTLLSIAILGMGPRNTSTFEYFIKKHAVGAFYVATPSESDTCIVDFDAPAGKAQWQLHSFDNKPCIILADENPYLEQTVWVKKPINAANMKAAIDELATLIKSPKKLAPANASVKHESKKPKAQKIEQPVEKAAKPAVGYQNNFSDAHSPSLNLSKKSIVECCGSRADGNLQDTSWRKEITYSPEKSLLYAIGKALQLAREKNQAVALEGLRTSVVVMPGGERIYVDLDSHLIRHICAMAMQQNPKVKPLNISLMECNKRYRETDRNMHNRNTVLWQVALWSSRGRLPKGITPNTPISLAFWPNFTRLTITPFAIAMASTWVQNTATAGDIAKQMDIPQRYVFAFVAAADAVGLLQKDAVEKSPSLTWQKPKGLLHSILRSLKAA